MRKQSLVEVIIEHGHKAWFLNEHQICVMSASVQNGQVFSERQIIDNDLTAVQNWLGY